MADIHIVRQHKLGLTKARAVAYRWAEQAEKDLQMTCTYEEGAKADEVCFTRPGAEGSLRVTATEFALSAKLGFLLGAFKSKIEAEIAKNLDTLLVEAPPAAKKPVARKK